MLITLISKLSLQWDIDDFDAVNKITSNGHVKLTSLKGNNSDNLSLLIWLALKNYHILVE